MFALLNKMGEGSPVSCEKELAFKIWVDIGWILLNSNKE
jgi:hypothetical protein